MTPTTPPPGDHHHPGFEPPDGHTDPHGRPGVDDTLLGHLAGAAFDGCRPCQDTLLDQVAADPATCARLVELACTAVQAHLGGLPPNLLDDDRPGLAAPAFRLLARAGADGELDRMHAASAGMAADERHAAADTALDLLVGHLTAPPPGGPGGRG